MSKGQELQDCVHCPEEGSVAHLLTILGPLL
jgi:hypothetical protein